MTLALALSLIGLYGMMAYSVTQRTSEFGIRLALGAQPADIVKLVLSQGMQVVGVGLLLGLACSFVLTRAVQSWRFGISATDPLTFGALAVLLCVITLLACYLPARRAARVDPMIVLRCE